MSIRRLDVARGILLAFLGGLMIAVLSHLLALFFHIDDIRPTSVESVNPAVAGKQLMWEIGERSATADSLSRFFDAYAVPAHCDASGNCESLSPKSQARFFYAIASSPQSDVIAEYDPDARVLWIYPSDASREIRALALCRAIAKARDHVTSSRYGDVVAQIERELRRVEQPSRNGPPSAVAVTTRK